MILKSQRLPSIEEKSGANVIKLFFSVADERSSLLENTELAQKHGTNTPAYFAGKAVTNKSCLTMLITGVNVLKHLQSMQNKLECLFLPNFSSLV